MILITCTSCDDFGKLDFYYSSDCTEVLFHRSQCVGWKVDSPSVQMKHLQRHAHRHRSRTAATPHTEMRIIITGCTETNTQTFPSKYSLRFKVQHAENMTSGLNVFSDVV